MAPLPYPPIRVLCVDDHPDAADSLGILLKMIGFVTEVCHDAAAALERAAAFRPDACVLDVNMPGMDGCELARRLRAAERPPLLVAVTALGDPDAVARTTAAGFDRHLVKPVMPQALLDVLFEHEARVRGG
jgi:CheY-like chemotaxis protein